MYGKPLRLVAQEIGFCAESPISFDKIPTFSRQICQYIAALTSEIVTYFRLSS